MGWIARAQLASAVSNAGAMGIIETSSGELDEVRDEIRKMRDLTDKPFGVNIAQAFVRDPGIVDFVIDQGVRFVTTSAGSPTRYTAALKDAGLTVFHVVPTLHGALKAVDAGVDGLVVEGAEGGGFKNPRDVSTMVLLPLVRSRVDVPIIAAGGFVDGRSMAAALALGAEGVQMGTRMVSAARVAGPRELEEGHPRRGRDRHGLAQPPHLPGAAGAAHRAHRRRSSGTPSSDAMALLGNAMALYFGGDMEASLALTGQVAGRIDDIAPVAEIIQRCVAELADTLRGLGERYPVDA